MHAADQSHRAKFDCHRWMLHIALNQLREKGSTSSEVTRIAEGSQWQLQRMLQSLHLLTAFWTVRHGTRRDEPDILYNTTLLQAFEQLVLYMSLTGRNTSIHNGAYSSEDASQF